MNDVSAFIGVGRRFSVDIKLHGLGTTIHVVQKEFSQFEPGDLNEFVTVTVPEICLLLSKSSSPKVRSTSEWLRSISLYETPECVLRYVITAIVDVNNFHANA